MPKRTTHHAFIQPLLLLALIISCSTAWAILDLTLTEGQSKQTSLVFATTTKKKPNTLLTKAQTILHQDLKRSGHFLMYNPRDAKQADYTLNLTVSPNAHTGWIIESNLNNDALQGKPALTLKTETQHRNLRTSLHKHSDALIEQWTGQHGINQSQIAYVLKTNTEDNQPTYRLMIADVDGQQTHPLLTSKQPILSPAFAKKSPYIAYVSFEHNHPVIYIQHLTQPKRRLISNYPGINSAPTWRYDDQTLVVALSGKSQTPSLYEIDRRHGHKKRLTQGNHLDTEPFMTQDPNTIWFTSNRAGPPHIFKLNRTTQHVSQITHHGTYHSRPVLTKDGKHLITLDRAKGQYQINLHHLINGTHHVLAQANHMEGAAVAPQAELILYATSDNTQHSTLRIMDFQGHITAQLTTPKGLIQDLAWK